MWTNPRSGWWRGGDLEQAWRPQHPTCQSRDTKSWTGPGHGSLLKTPPFTSSPPSYHQETIKNIFKDIAENIVEKIIGDTFENILESIVKNILDMPNPRELGETTRQEDAAKLQVLRLHKVTKETAELKALMVAIITEGQATEHGLTKEVEEQNAVINAREREMDADTKAKGLNNSPTRGRRWRSRTPSSRPGTRRWTRTPRPRA